MQKFMIFLTALIGLGFVIAASIMFFQTVLRERKEAQAEVLSGEVESFQDTDGDGNVANLFRSKYQVRYLAEGRLFETALRSRTGTTNRAAVETKLRSNPVGSRRTIYYLARRPEEFEYEPVVRRFGFSLLTFSIGAFVAGVAIMLWYSGQPVDW